MREWSLAQPFFGCRPPRNLLPPTCAPNLTEFNFNVRSSSRRSHFHLGAARLIVEYESDGPVRMSRSSYSHTYARRTWKSRWRQRTVTSWWTCEHIRPHTNPKSEGRKVYLVFICKRKHWPGEQQGWKPRQPDLGSGSSVTTVTAQGDTSMPAVFELINRSDSRWGKKRSGRTGLSRLCACVCLCKRQWVCATAKQPDGVVG